MSPFQPSVSRPGYGEISLSIVPPQTPRLQTTSYQYPLKLVAPAPLRTASDDRHLIHTVYLLTYGGGLVAGDSIDLHIKLEASTRLILLTQGSTKLFKSPGPELQSKQCTTTTLASGSALCYLPDPVQPFERSCFQQEQTYNLACFGTEGVGSASLCLLDWVSNGRSANGENWSFFRYASRNEIHLMNSDGRRRLLLRDCVTLEDHAVEGVVAARMAGLGVFATLILHGRLFQALGRFLVNEFETLPRLGGRQWDSGSESGEEITDPRAAWRALRQRQETAEALIWSVASVRECVVVKFGAPEVEGAKRWLRSMLLEEGTVVTEFGERALLCLR